MKAVFLSLFFLCSILVATAQQQVIFHSSDKKLEQAFEWAKAMALSYKGKPGDPVGPWYESALPPRSAFCMRDVAHQSIGGEILGLHAENKNMLSLFAQNIAESRDWCSYWEMNREGMPAPEDYRNDDEFWYNLNANFDILHACWRMYLWTGDKTFITDPQFERFHDLTTSDYIERWKLQPDSLLLRPARLNAPIPFNENDAFHRCRGLPSYSEGVPHLKMGIDLIASIYRAHESYTAMQDLLGNTDKARAHRLLANKYQNQIARRWWDDSAQRFHTHVTDDQQFGKGEGETFLLWFESLKDSVQINSTIKHLTSQDWNVENLSYFPFVLSRYGYYDDAYRYIIHLADSNTKRREYPEVSFGVIEGIVQGLMGIDADARVNRIETRFGGQPGTTLAVEHLPIMQTAITVIESENSTLLRNTGMKKFTWRSSFYGADHHLIVDGKKFKTQYGADKRNRRYSFVDIVVMPGQEIQVTPSQQVYKRRNSSKKSITS